MVQYCVCSCVGMTVKGWVGRYVVGYKTSCINTSFTSLMTQSILSHMTDAVTGVVPTWMKSMFTKNEEEKDSEVVSEPASPDFDPDAPSTSYGTGYPPVQRTHAVEVNEEDASHRSQHRKREEEEEAIQMGIPQRKHTPLPFIAYTQPIQTSTPVDNDFIQQPLRNVQTEERGNLQSLWRFCAVALEVFSVKEIALCQ